MATVLYNWPIFAGIMVFGIVSLATGTLLGSPWNWLLILAGILVFGLAGSVLVGSFIVYDWGSEREYKRLADLGDLEQANVVIDVTAGKLRGTRGLLPLVKGGHYFIVDIFDPEKMTDQALRRARELEPRLEADRRLYRRSARPDSLPIPHNWADVVYCSFSLHELGQVADREVIFREFNRILKPGGRLLVAEHGRDWRNLLVFGPGALSFFAPATWTRHIGEAGFTITHHERWRGLVHLWVAEKENRRREAARQPIAAQTRGLAGQRSSGS
jgi:ubiquinone/menaquinone biosynthesis C-methylase UbiE